VYVFLNRVSNWHRYYEDITVLNGKLIGFVHKRAWISDTMYASEYLAGIH
jgi:hypothetical protein